MWINQENNQQIKHYFLIYVIVSSVCSQWPEKQWPPWSWVCVLIREVVLFAAFVTNMMIYFSNNKYILNISY